MHCEVVDLSEESEVDWDTAIERSVNGTLFHLRKFLAYHINRFSGREYFVGFQVRGQIVARLCFSVVKRDGLRLLLSPYGASYGGLVFMRPPAFQEAIAVTDALIRLGREMLVDEIHLAYPIKACLRASLDTADFALLNRGFELSVRDITSVYVRGTSKISDRGRRSAQKAARLGVTLDWDPSLADFWQVVEATYSKHGVPPTHSVEEFDTLRHLLGSRITLCVAHVDGYPAAALGCFRLTHQVDSAFYICSDPYQNKTQALSFLISERLARMDADVSYFSFGTSSYEMVPRENIFQFKENFTKIGMFRDTYTWKAS